VIKQIEINGQGTWDDLGVYVEASPIIGTALPMSKYVPIPGADGAVDMSTALTDGEIRYAQRSISFALVIPPGGGGETKRRTLEGMHNGQELMLRFDSDPSHYFIGRAAVESSGAIDYGGSIVKLEYKVTADPWRYKNDQTTKGITLGAGGVGTLVLENECRSIAPSLTASTNLNLIFLGVQYAMNAGTRIISGIKLNAGTNTISVSGASGATLSATYQEASM
jgi:hypothetical protein